MKFISQKRTYVEYKCLVDIVCMYDIPNTDNKVPYHKFLDYIYNKDKNKLNYRERLNESIISNFDACINGISEEYKQLSVHISKFYEEYGNIVIVLFDILTLIKEDYNSYNSSKNLLPSLYKPAINSDLTNEEIKLLNIFDNKFILKSISSCLDTNLREKSKVKEFIKCSPFTECLIKFTDSIFKFQKKLSVMNLSQIGAKSPLIVDGLIKRANAMISYQDIRNLDSITGALINSFVASLKSHILTSNRYCDVQGLIANNMTNFLNSWVVKEYPHLRDENMTNKFEIDGKDGSKLSSTEKYTHNIRYYDYTKNIMQDLKNINKINECLFYKSNYSKLTYTLYEWMANKQLSNRLHNLARIFNPNINPENITLQYIGLLRENPSEFYIDPGNTNAIGAPEYASKIKYTIEFIDTAYRLYCEANGGAGLYNVQQEICSKNDELLINHQKYNAPYLIPGEDYMNPNYLNKIVTVPGGFKFKDSTVFGNFKHIFTNTDVDILSKRDVNEYILTDSGINKINDLLSAFNSLDNLKKYLNDTPEKLTLADLPLKRLLEKNVNVTDLSGLLNLNIIDLSDSQKNILKTRYPKSEYTKFNVKSDLEAESEQFKTADVDIDTSLNSVSSRKSISSSDISYLNDVASSSDLTPENVYYASLYYIMKLAFPESINSKLNTVNFKEFIIGKDDFNDTLKLEFYKHINPISLKRIFGILLMMCRYTNLIKGTIKVNRNSTDEFHTVIHQFQRFFSVTRPGGNNSGQFKEPNCSNQLFLTMLSNFLKVYDAYKSRTIAQLSGILNKQCSPGFYKCLDLEYALKKGESFLYNTADTVVELISGNYAVFNKKQLNPSNSEISADDIAGNFRNNYLRFNFLTYGRLLKYNNEYYELPGSSIKNYYIGNSDGKGYSSAHKHCNNTCIANRTDAYILPISKIGTNRDVNMVNVLTNKEHGSVPLDSSQYILKTDISVNNINGIANSGDLVCSSGMERYYRLVFRRVYLNPLDYDIDSKDEDDIDMTIFYNDNLTTLSREMLYERATAIAMLDPFSTNSDIYAIDDKLYPTRGEELISFRSCVITPKIIIDLIYSLLHHITLVSPVYANSTIKKPFIDNVSCFPKTPIEYIKMIKDAVGSNYNENNPDNIKYINLFKGILIKLQENYPNSKYTWNSLGTSNVTNFKFEDIFSLTPENIIEKLSSITVVSKPIEVTEKSMSIGNITGKEAESTNIMTATGDTYRIFDKIDDIYNVELITSSNYDLSRSPIMRKFADNGNKSLNVENRDRHSGFSDYLCFNGYWSLSDVNFVMHGVYISTVSPIPNNKAITLMFARAYSAALQTSVMYNLANDANLMHKMISDTFIPRPTSDSLTTPNSIKNQLLASRAEMKTKEGYDKTVILIQPLSQLALYSSSISADDYIHRFNDMRKSKSKIAPLFYPVDPTLTSEFVRNFLVVQQSLISDTALQSSKSIGEFIQKINSDANVYIKSSILNKKKNTILSSDAKLKQHILSNYHNDYDAIASYKRNRVLEYQLESMSINDSNLSDEIKEVLKSSTEYDKNTGVVLRNGIPYQKYWYWSDEDYSNNIGNRAYLDKSGLWIKISHNVVGQTLVMLSTSLTPNSIEKAKRERKYE